MKTKIETEPLADWYPVTQQFKLTLKVSWRSPRTLEAYDLAIRALLSYLLKMGLRIGPPVALRRLRPRLPVDMTQS